MTIISRCEQTEAACAYALQAVPPSEVASIEAHIASCADCQQELAGLQPVVKRFVSWPADVLRPSTSLQSRLAHRIAAETGKPSLMPPERQWSEPEWQEVAPGIECKLLATDTERQRVSMLVRLEPGASYPQHTHAGVEELHLLDGELWINERKLFPGDYNYGPPGASDYRVWSDDVGLSTSVGQETSRPITGCKPSSSHLQSGHAAKCALSAGTSLEGRACRA